MTTEGPNSSDAERPFRAWISGHIAPLVVLSFAFSLVFTALTTNHSWTGYLADLAIGVAISLLFFWIEAQVRVVRGDISRLSDKFEEERGIQSYPH